VTRFLTTALAGMAAGALSGALGVGGGILAQPALRLLVGAREIVAVATPLPMILPTALTGALTYRKAGEIDMRAAGWMAPAGALGSIVGALLTQVVEPGILLVITAGLLAWQSANVIRGGRIREVAFHDVPGWRFAGLGIAAGALSGLLGIGGGLIMVPALAGFMGMPLKRPASGSLRAEPATRAAVEPARHGKQLRAGGRRHRPLTCRGQSVSEGGFDPYGLFAH
jgi:hypothetical protein